ncbi:conserved hypothetical protein [Vibrio nigripulchritudo MADA3029]|nr:conserved hypothetical protein [Vibrio nigripulchritudo MADA3020]CCN54246.1 conserved hypothetical protein [Vibrio nigripulchritudo MADA3021]CCN61317.1 conserved hypothetical protein [Vibrio nigripulchritudo MADA3029]
MKEGYKLKILRYILFSAGLTFSFNVSASQIVTPIGVGCDTEDGTCFVILKEHVSNSECTQKNQLRLNPNKKGSQGQYSAALAAVMGGKKLRVALNGCHQNHPAPSWFYVTD